MAVWILHPLFFALPPSPLRQFSVQRLYGRHAFSVFKFSFYHEAASYVGDTILVKLRKWRDSEFWEIQKKRFCIKLEVLHSNSDSCPSDLQIWKKKSKKENCIIAKSKISGCHCWRSAVFDVAFRIQASSQFRSYLACCLVHLF